MRWKRGNRLRLVSEGDAPPRIRQIFDEVRDSLGLPVVPVLYQAYAAFPEFLELHWRAFRPAVRSRQFFALGARLAAESYTRAHNYLAIPALTTCDPHPQVSPKLPMPQVLDYYQYLDSLLLLITAAQMQAFEASVGLEGKPEPPYHPCFPVAPSLLDDAAAGPAEQHIWEDRKRVLGVAFISDEHRALACWPDFYQRYWSSLKTLLQSPLYADCQYRLGESAWTMVRELPVRIEMDVPLLLDSGMPDEEVSSIARLNAAFLQAMTGLVLDITFARIACDGGTFGQGTATPQRESLPAPKKRRATKTRAA
jgi:hypothetical protein